MANLLFCRVEAGLTNTEVMRSNVVRSVQQKIGTAFYREYLRRMLEQMPALLDQLKDDNRRIMCQMVAHTKIIILDGFDRVLVKACIRQVIYNDRGTLHGSFQVFNTRSGKIRC